MSWILLYEPYKEAQAELDRTQKKLRNMAIERVAVKIAQSATEARRKAEEESARIVTFSTTAKPESPKGKGKWSKATEAIKSFVERMKTAFRDLKN